MKWVETIAKKLGVNRDKVLPAIFATALTLLWYITKNYTNGAFQDILWTILIALIGLILLTIMLAAGYAIFEALVYAGAGFTVLIFLAQTYCGLPNRTPEGVQALSFLWSVGLLYIFFKFGTRFQQVCKDYLARMGRDWKSWEGWTVIILFVLFTIVFIAAILQVFDPIVRTLCVYQQ